MRNNDVLRAKLPHRVIVCVDSATAPAIRLALGNAPDFQIIEEAADLQEAVAKVTRLKPDLVLMEDRLPEVNGAEAARQILSLAPRMKILAYSADYAWETVERMLEAGVAGYVVKGPDLHEVVRAARILLAGGNYLSLSLLHPAHAA